jgi:hypothetical protein
LAGEYFYFFIRKNGAGTYTIPTAKFFDANVNISAVVNGNALISLKAGEYIEILVCEGDASGDASLSGDPNVNWVEMQRIGGVM